MDDSRVVDLSRRGVLSYDEACERVLVLRSLTAKYVEKVEKMMTQLESLSQEQIERIQDLEENINTLIHEWHGKVRKLAGVPKGLWLVDFDAGFGYYCWKFPESRLQYWHKYNEGFEARKKITVDNGTSFDTENVVSLNL